MLEKQRKPNKVLMLILILAVAFFALFFIALFAFGIAGSGLKDLFNYFADNFEPLLTLNYSGGSIAIKTMISILFYALLLMNVIFLIIGVMRITKSGRMIVVFALVDIYLALFAYIFAGLGAGKFWGAIRDNDKSTQFAAVLVIFAIIFCLVFAYLGLVLALREAKLHPVGAKKVQKKADDEAVLFEEVDEDAVEEAPAEEAKEVKDLNKENLADLLREVVRDIVKDEMAKNAKNDNGSTLTGATFGGPLVVQYFNGGINSTPNPAQNPQPASEQPAPVVGKEAEPAPVMEEVQPAQEEPVPEPVIEAPAEPVEKKPIIRIPFIDRMVSADKEMQNNYNELKNEILSYGVNSRVSNSGDTFRLHRKTYIKLTIAGLSLKLYFALDPNDYKDSTLPVQDAGHKGIYEEIPLVFKVKSGLSMRRCKQLIQDVMEKDGLEQGEVGQVNWVNELKAQLKAGKKSSDD